MPKAKAFTLRVIRLTLVCAFTYLQGTSYGETKSAATSALQSSSGLELSDARTALKKAVAFHREAKDLTLLFTASVFNVALEKNEEYQGKLLLKGASKFRLEIPGGVYVSDGETFWEYHPKTKQVVLKRAKELEDKPLPGDVLLRFLDSDPISVKKIQEKGKDFLEMSLDPARAMKNLDSLSVVLNKKDYSLHSISSRDVSGNETKYTVKKIKRNGGIKDKQFAFDIPKGTDAVDMRE